MKRILRSVAFFQSLSESHLELLVNMAVSRSFDGGGVLFTEGQVENHLYLLEEGSVEITREGAHFGRQTFAQLGPGDHFGALSLFYSEPHFATATAVAPTRLWMIRHEDFQARLRRNPKLALAILRGMSAGIRAANAEIRLWTSRFDRRPQPAVELPTSSRALPRPGWPSPPSA